MIGERRTGIERRPGRFTEVLSTFMVKVAAIGAFVVLVDIKFTVTAWGQVVQIGSGFSPDLKGAVIASILISGYTAVKEYWLGASASGQTQSDTMSRIAEGVPPNPPKPAQPPEQPAATAPEQRSLK